MSVLRESWIIMKKDMRQRVRDRTGLLVAFVAPLAIAGVMGAALSNVDGGVDMDLVIIPGAAPERATEFAEWLEGQTWLGEGFRVQRLGEEALVREQIEAGDVEAAVAFGAASPRVITTKRNVLGSRAMEGLVDRFLVESAVSSRATAVVVPESPGGQLRMIDYFAANMCVLFLTFGVLSGVRSLQEEKESGALSRLTAAPINPLSVIVGKFGGLFLQGAIQMALMIAATSLLFDTKWGAAIPVVALVATTVFMSIGLASLFMSLGQTPEQGSLYATIAIFMLAVVGGQFLPPQGLPAVFDTLQRLTPTGQSGRAFVDLAAAGPGAGLRFIWEPLLFTSVVGIIGVSHGVRRANQALQRALA